MTAIARNNLFIRKKVVEFPDFSGNFKIYDNLLFFLKKVLVKLFDTSILIGGINIFPEQYGDKNDRKRY